MFPFIYSFAKIKEDSMGNKTGNGAVICTMVFQDTLHSNDIITYVVWWHFIPTMLMIEFEDSPYKWFPNVLLDLLSKNRQIILWGNKIEWMHLPWELDILDKY